MPSRTLDDFPAPCQPGSSTDHLPKAVTTADKKSAKSTLSPEMKASHKAIQDMDAPYLATDARWRQNLCREHALKPRNLTQQQLDLVRHKTGYVWCARGEYGWPYRQRTDDFHKSKLFTNCLSRQLRHALHVFPYHSEDGCIFICDLLAFANSNGFLNDRKNTLHPS